MGAITSIEWADHTFNPWVGCTKISPACDHCYAESWAKRSGLVQWGSGAPRRRTTDSNWQQPRKWNADAAAKGIRYRVFCASLADVFDNEVPAEWRLDLFSLIAETPNLDWLILTKRIGNVIPMCSGDSMMFDLISERVWLGITVVTQDEANRDVPKLLAIPAHKRFLSCEPLLGPVNIGRWLELGRWDSVGKPLALKTLNWVIVGGESGPGARPMHPDWARSLRDQCAAADVPFLFKQWGEWLPGHHYTSELQAKDIDLDQSRYSSADFIECSGEWEFNTWEHGEDTLFCVGKKNAGRLLDGVAHDQFPK